MAEEMCQKQPGKNWFPRFLKRWSDTLDSTFLGAINRSRQSADDCSKYKRYFDKVENVTRKYRVLPENTYNMDEKGFLIGLFQKLKRVFNKSLKQSGKLKGVGQDGSREWITCLATIC
ncbi:hypothetical protein EJ08DRAFT_606141 [Tothia fuscella]|uniref:Uncharacterized protein n=1 Tax=Tothia fuscella TaxID=1048955 RepID=A0A9P4NYV7_9PEZI|nr:hypothetical protein EJ08DRAFT_606141 [Tothia fuscella]